MDNNKSILFASKQRSKNIHQLNIGYNHINIKQHLQVTYLGCVLDKKISCEPMKPKVTSKKNGKLKFLYRKNRYLTKELHRMLCNALIQLHFDYAYLAWYPNLNEKMKKKNILPTSKRVDQCINTITYNFVNNTCPYYLNEIFEFSPYCSIGTRNSSLYLEQLI